MNLPGYIRTAFDLMLEATVSAALLAILVGAVQWTFRKQLSPAWRFALWLPVLLRLLVPVLPESPVSFYNLPRWIAAREELTIQKPDQGLIQPAVASPAITLPDFSPAVTTIDMESGAGMDAAIPINRRATQPRRHIDWISIAAAVWLTGALLLLARVAAGSLWLGLRLKRNSRGCTAESEAILEGAAETLRLHSLPRLASTDSVRSPALFGLFRPVLLLPIHFAEQMTPSEVRHVFLHEMAHLKRRDLLLNGLMTVAQAVHWFNPVVWLVLWRMRLEREMACDEMVLHACLKSDPKEYGRTILRLLEGIDARQRIPGLVGIAEEKYSAGCRLRSIAAYKGGSRRSWLAVPMAAAIGIAGLTNAETPSAGLKLPEETLAEPRQRMVTASALIQDARLLLQMEKLNEAEAKLREALKIEPENNNASYYLELIQERKSRPSRLMGKENLDTLTDLPFGKESLGPEKNPWAEDQRITADSGRVKISRKLESVVIPVFGFPNPAPLGTVIQSLQLELRELDEAKSVINFIINPSPVLNAEGTEKISEYLVRIHPPLENIRAIDLLKVITEIARPPEGSNPTNRIKFSIEDYGVVFSQKVWEPEPLYTRTFRVDPNLFLDGIKNIIKPAVPVHGMNNPLVEGELSELQKSVRNFFIAAGVDFGTNSPSDGENLSVGQSVPRKALFFNDRTGVLFVRAPLRDLDVIESALQALNVSGPEVETEGKEK